jgi:hypothetical protein
MPYKPKYCCQCGEKIDRIDWKPWSSRRFCELCETELGIYDWIPRGILLIGLLFGIVGVGGYWQKADKPLRIASNQTAGASPNINKNAVNQADARQSSANQNNQTLLPLQPTNSAPKTQQQLTQTAQNLKTKQVETPPNFAAETMYFCGAQTKKGTPCSRRVKGGGRCWQHTGQPAMLPPEKLIASQ